MAALQVNPSDLSSSSSMNKNRNEKILNQRQLYIHALACLHHEEFPPGDQLKFNCNNLPHCKIMRRILQHAKICEEGKDCTVPHCNSSRQFIAHWNNCKLFDCPVCLPLRQDFHTDARKIPKFVEIPEVQELFDIEELETFERLSL